MDARTLRNKIEGDLATVVDPAKKGMLSAALGFLNLSEKQSVTYNSRLATRLGFFDMLDPFFMGQA